jgi:hypothetical protein
MNKLYKLHQAYNKHSYRHYIAFKDHTSTLVRCRCGLIRHLMTGDQPMPLCRAWDKPSSIGDLKDPKQLPAMIKAVKRSYRLEAPND